jgi:hypothetical protein
MRKTGGGIGFIVVLIAAAIVMILAMKQWIAVAPQAQQIMAIDQANRIVNGQKGKAKAKAAPKPGEHGQGSVEDQQKRGVLPDLQDMKDGTDQHAKEIADAMKDSNK